MLSIIICSISPVLLSELELNIQNTIGVEYEIIAIDNREKKWSIAKVYNYGAERAIYPFLLFVHEDVKFHSKGWGIVIESKLSEPDCGVIGFAGSQVKLDAYSGWSQDKKWNCSYYYQRQASGLTEFAVEHVYVQYSFQRILLVDGFAMFVRKDVWKVNVFDEDLLTGFHCYDLDFSLQVARRYINYICCNDVLVEHYSSGVYNDSWYVDTIRLHSKKWNDILPMSIESIDFQTKKMRKIRDRISYGFMKEMMDTGCKSNYKLTVLKMYWHNNSGLKHFRRCLSCAIRFLRT